MATAAPAPAPTTAPPAGTPANPNDPSSSGQGLVAENFCNTFIKVSRFTSKWTIDNFSFVRGEIGEELRGPPFCTGLNDKIRWCVKIFPKGTDQESKDYVSLYLLLVHCNRSEVRAKFRFSIINGDRREDKPMLSSRAFRFVQGKDWGFKKYIRRDVLFTQGNNLVLNDRLTVLCEVNIVGQTSNQVTQLSQSPILLPESQFSKVMGELYETSRNADFVIQCEDKEFKVHKAILAGRSEVFDKKIDDVINDPLKKYLVIEDMKPDILDEVLRFIYTDKSPGVDVKAKDLLPASKAYKLPLLLVHCEEALFRSMHIENVAELFCLADKHGADQLRQCAHNYLNNHAADVLKTKNWTELCKANPNLAIEAFNMTTNKAIKLPTQPKKKKK